MSKKQKKYPEIENQRAQISCPKCPIEASGPLNAIRSVFLQAHLASNCPNRFHGVGADELATFGPSRGDGIELPVDRVNHPAHYNRGKIEVIEFLEDQKLDFHLANAVKYIARAEHKGREVEDLEKAVWYLRRKIELLKPNPARPNDMPQARA